MAFLLVSASYTPDANEDRRCIQMCPMCKHAHRICHDSLHSSVLLDFLSLQLKKKTLEVTVWDYDRSSSNDFLGEVSAVLMFELSKAVLQLNDVSLICLH